MYFQNPDCKANYFVHILCTIGVPITLPVVPGDARVPREHEGSLDGGVGEAERVAELVDGHGEHRGHLAVHHPPLGPANKVVIG